MFEQIKMWAVEQVMWAEKNLKGKSGEEKKAAVIKKLDDMIPLPSYLEWGDDIIIGKLVDMAGEKLSCLSITSRFQPFSFAIVENIARKP